MKHAAPRPDVAASGLQLPLLRRLARGCGREANSEEKSYG